MERFAVKPLTNIHADLSLARPNPNTQPPITLESPAQSLLTDFTKTQALSIPATMQIDEALQQMIVVGVRLLFVTDTEFRLIGLVTSYDIAGEKPLLYMQAQGSHFGSSARTSIQVQHIMQPISTWSVLDFHTVEHAEVGDILATLKYAGLPHLVVVQQAPTTSAFLVRGIFSARQFERALSVSFDQWQRPNSFAELERTLDHPLDSPQVESNPWQSRPRTGLSWGR